MHYVFKLKETLNVAGDSLTDESKCVCSVMSIRKNWLDIGYAALLATNTVLLRVP